jgi:hypothetical protein
MKTLSDILQDRINAFNEDPKKALKLKSIEYNKQWNYAVKCFQVRINEDREKEDLKPVEFIAVRMRLEALKEIDDMRYFFNQCKQYAKTKDKTGKPNSFSKIFWGATKPLK